MDIPLPKVLYDVEAGGPLVTSLRGENELLKGMEELKNKKLQNQFYTPNIESEINNRNSLTKRNEIDNLTLNAKNILANEYQKLQNQGYMPNLQSEIGLRSSQANRSNQLLPLDIQQEQIKNQFLPELTKSEIYKNTTGNLGTGGNDQKLYESYIKKDNPTFNDDEAYEASNKVQEGKYTLDNGKPINFSKSAKNSLDRVVKAGTNSQGLNQQRFSNTADFLLNEADQILPNIAKYSSGIGKGQNILDKISTAAGENSNDYNDYTYFTRTLVPLIAGEMGRELGKNASDESTKIMKQVVNPISWDRDYPGTLSQFNRLINLNKGIGKTVSQSSSEIKSNLQNSKLSTEKIYITNGSKTVSGSPDKIEAFLKDHPDWKRK